MWMLAIPTGPGRCRCLWWFFHPSRNAPKRLRKLAAQPVWKDHLTRNLVFDGDNVFLHGAVRLVACSGPGARLGFGLGRLTSGAARVEGSPAKEHRL
jgi:hypothetical protein